MHTKDDSNKSVSYWWDICERELRFFILFYFLQRWFALLDLDRDWIES